jgi:hypothetical protein
MTNMLFSKSRIFLFIIVLSLISLFYSINSYSTSDLDNKFQLAYFALPSQTISGAILVIPQQELQNGTILPLTMGNISSGAAIILPIDMLERGAILPLYLNKSTHSIYPKNSSNNLIVVPEKMLSGGIIDIRKGNMSTGAAIILPQDALDNGAALSFKKGNVSDGILIILTKEIINNKQIFQLPQGGAILPITHANISHGAIILLPSLIVEDKIIPLPKEKTILPFTDANITDGGLIILSNKSLDQGGTFQIPEGSDIQSFLHGDTLLSIPKPGPPFPDPTKDLNNIDLVKTLTPVVIPDNSFFLPKNAAPIYLPNNSLLVENNIKKLTELPDNSLLVPNEGPLSKLNESALVVKSNYGHPINLPNGSLIGINGEILVPLPKVSLIHNGTDAPIPLPEGASLLVANNTGTPLPSPEGVSLLIVTDKSPPSPETGQTSNLTGGPPLGDPTAVTSTGTGGPPLGDPTAVTSNLTGGPPFPPSKASLLIVANGTGTPFPPPKVSLLVSNGIDAPIPLPEGASLLVANGTEVQNLFLNDSRIVSSNEGWFLILPNSLGTVILPSDGQIIKNLPQGTVILPSDGQIIKNLPQGTVIMPKKVIKNLPQAAILTPFLPFESIELQTIPPQPSPSSSPPPTTITTTTNDRLSTPKEFNIAISADWGCSASTKETVKNLQDKNPELIVAAGDLSYQELTGSCWIEEIIKPVENKTKIAFGDHDYIGIGEYRKPKQDYLAHFDLPRTYYSFDHENVHFLVMDPYAEYGINSNQFKFVQDDLQLAYSNQSINWIFVVEHVPLYTSPAQHPADSTIRDIYHPLFDKYGVDLVISGDNHNYQRTFPLKYNYSNSNSSNPIITDRNPTNYKGDYQGQIYLITGVGGRSLYELKGQAPFVVTQNDKHFGYIDINIKGNNLEGSFYSNQVSLNEGRNNYTQVSVNEGRSNYTLIDKFSISKDT